jgi:endo-1,4-beta-mannosidase
MRKVEDQTLADPFYMQNKQSKVSEQDRAWLVNRVFQIARHFQLREETVFLTVNMADRYLSQQLVDSKIEMALVFCASMLIATKYEEIYPPTGKELLQTMLKSKDRAAMYTHEDLLQMEFNILKEIEYSVQETSALAFV